MIFEVSEFDNDYNSFCRYIYMKAHNKKDVQNKCDDLIWTGHTYIINRMVPHSVDRITYDLTTNDYDFSC